MIRTYPAGVGRGSFQDHAEDLRPLAASLRSAELPGWLTEALDPAPLAEALRGRITELVPDALALVDVRLEDARVRRSWSLCFRADVATPAGTRPVVLAARRAVSGIGLGTGVGAGALPLPCLGLDVAVVHGDPALPALPVLLDPGTARPLIEAALREGGRSGVGLAEDSPHLVRHKPGHRATVVHDLTSSTAAGPERSWRAVTKTYADDTAPATYAWMRALWESDLDHDGVPRLAEPLGCLVGHRTLLQRAVPGTGTLADLVLAPAPPAGGPSVESALEATADGLNALHRCAVAAGPRRTTAGPVATGRRLLDRVGPSLPGRARDDAAALLDLLAALAATAGVDEQERTVPVHGAFRPGQVLLDGARPGFVDFDGFGQGEPALDVGVFLARLLELVADDSRRTGLTHVFLDRYRTRAALPADRTALWVLLALATGVVRSWSRARTDRARLLLDRLDDAIGAQW